MTRDSKVRGSSGTDPLRHINPLDWARVAGAEDLVKHAMDLHVRRKRRLARAVGTSVAVLAVAGAVWFSRPIPSPLDARPPRLIVSAPVRQVLADGSLVELREHASITVNFSATSRRVLLADGEAHFQVTKNEARPFVVEVNGIQVRAVGTAFAVQPGPSNLEVLVTEGRVAVERSTNERRIDRNPPASADALVPAELVPETKILATVDAGNRVVIDLNSDQASNAQVEAVSSPAMTERLAWRIPLLEFDATPLADVLPIINRHSGMQLSLANPELGRLTLSGVLRANNVPVLLKILESSYEMKSERRGDRELLLYRTP